MYDALYERGEAVGHSDIKTDTIHFQWKGEEFTFPTVKVYGIARWNGYFYTAPVDGLRALERESATG